MCLSCYNAILGLQKYLGEVQGMVIRKVLKTFSRKGVVGSSPTLTAEGYSFIKEEY